MLVTQPDHAALAGSLMNLWRSDGFPEHPRRQQLLHAIREHDSGWREADAAPRVDPVSGKPLTFNEISPEDRLRIWRRGVHRVAAEAPVVGLLVLKHALEIHPDYWNEAGWNELGEDFAELEEELLAVAGVTRSLIQNDYKFLELADTLSLGACGALGTDLVRSVSGRYRFELEVGRIALSPFPLAGATTLGIACRTLTKTTFESDAALAAELAVSTWSRLPVHVEPLDDR